MSKDLQHFIKLLTLIHPEFSYDYYQKNDFAELNELVRLVNLQTKSISNSRNFTSEQSIKDFIARTLKGEKFHNKDYTHHKLAAYYLKKVGRITEQFILENSPPIKKWKTSGYFEKFIDYTDENGFKNEITYETIKNENDEKIPQYLYGIYEGYYVRPFGKSEVKQMSVMIVNIEPSSIYVKTTDTKNNYYIGTYEFVQHPPSLNCDLTYNEYVNNTSSNHKFRLTFKIDGEDRFKAEPFLQGTYCGNNPKVKHPIAGRVILKKIVEYSKDFNYLYLEVFNELNPISLKGNEITELFETDKLPFELLGSLQLKINQLNKLGNLENSFSFNTIYSFFLNSEFVENIDFFSSYRLGNELEKRNIAGEYSIFTLHSKSKIVIGVGRIDSLGNVTIKGSPIRGSIKTITYEGFAKIFDENFLSINMNVKIEDKPEDYDISYILSCMWDGRSNTNYFHGVRILETVGKHPSSARVVFVKEANGFFDNAFVKDIPIFPFKDGDTDLRIYDSAIKKENKKFFENTPNLYRDIFNYLSIEENNLVIAPIGQIFPQKINYGEVFFYAALQIASTEIMPDKLKVLRYLEKAWLNGFNDAKRLKKEVSVGGKFYFIKDFIKIYSNDFFCIKKLQE